MDWVSEAVLKAFKEINSFISFNLYYIPIWYSIIPILESGNWNTEKFSNLLKVTSNHLTYHLKPHVFWWPGKTRVFWWAGAADTWHGELVRHDILGNCRLDPQGSAQARGGICGWPPSGRSSRALWTASLDSTAGVWQLDANASFRRREGSGVSFICLVKKYSTNPWSWCFCLLTILERSHWGPVQAPLGDQVAGSEEVVGSLGTGSGTDGCRWGLCRDEGPSAQGVCDQLPLQVRPGALKGPFSSSTLDSPS